MENAKNESHLNYKQAKYNQLYTEVSGNGIYRIYLRMIIIIIIIIKEIQK